MFHYMIIQASVQVSIPKAHHRFIIRQKNRTLADLELQTATKVSVPRSDDPSELITITGTKDGIEKARHEIQMISDEQVFVLFLFPLVYLYVLQCFIMSCTMNLVVAGHFCHFGIFVFMHSAYS